MPGMYSAGEYDLAGFGVGIVDRKDIIDGRTTKIGDLVLGLESSGLHSNGYSLVRKVFTGKELKKYAPELLKPTRLYCKSVLEVKKAVRIKGIANITGGAFYDKIPRIIPKGMAIEIFRKSWWMSPIFKLIQEKGNIDYKEMYRTLNMGIGMVLVLARKDIDVTKYILLRHGIRSHVIGQVIKGNKEVIIRG
jgi:phosphoribosylformylglycinamidine cyclo-ligase